MGQIILYNVTFSVPPTGNVNVNVFYRKESTQIWNSLGSFPAYPTGQFVNPVIIPTDDDTWYFVKAELNCAPCFAEKKLYSAAGVKSPCCAPAIIKAYVQNTEGADITWEGVAAVCLKNVGHYNTGYLRYISRRRLINGVPDGYMELNTAGPNFVADVLDTVQCPLASFSWTGLYPKCLVDSSGYNTGIKHWTVRARLVNGAPDGYTEANNPGANYVADVQDLTNCPVPVFTWRGASPFCAKDGFGNNTGYLGYTRRERMINGIPDGYSESNTPGTNYVPPIYDPVSCPLPGISWQGSGPVCVVDTNGFNTGGVRYTIRVRLVNGVPDGYSEPNTPGPSYVADYVDTTMCPVPVITWIGMSPVCLVDPFGNNTGYLGYLQRQRVVNGVPDGFVEDNVSDSSFIPPVFDTISCPASVPIPTTTVPATTTTVPPAPLITWEGQSPACQKVPSCPAGYVLSPDGLSCTKEDTASPSITVSGYCLAASPSGAYGPYGSRIYNHGFAQSSIMALPAPAGDVFAEMSTYGQWQNDADGLHTLGPCNRSAIWIDSNCDGSRDALVAGTKTTITGQFYNAGTERTVYVGCFGDNQFQLKVNENVIAASTLTNDLPFRIFHIFPVTLVSGMNYFNLVGTGDGSANDAIGMIVYDDTPAAIRDATSDATLHIIYNSATLIGTTYSVATCPVTYILDASNPAAYICRKFTRQDSALANSGNMIYATRRRLVNGIPDGYTEPNTVGANYVAGYSDTATCPVP